MKKIFLIIGLVTISSISFAFDGERYCSNKYAADERELRACLVGIASSEGAVADKADCEVQFVDANLKDICTSAALINLLNR